MLIIMVTFNNDVNNKDQHLMMLIIMVTFNNDVNDNGNI